MKILFDSDKCRGHLQCVVAADDLFTYDDLGNGVLIGDGECPPGREAGAKLAVSNCPEHAIALAD